MRKIDESKITSDKSMFFKQGTWTHLQKAYKEITEETIKSLIGSSYDATKVYVLNGCVNSGSGSSFNISAGSVFYAGEVYLVDATTFTTSGGNVAVGTITTTNNTTDYSADPCLFTDGTYENVHNIRKFVIASGGSGSGTKNYSDFVFDIMANNYEDINSSISVNGSFTPLIKIAREYADGTVFVYCILAFTSTIPIYTNILTGIPSCPVMVLGAMHGDDATTLIKDDLFLYGSGQLSNRFAALTNPATPSNTLLLFSFSYKKI